jgi:hypothetical protein
MTLDPRSAWPCACGTLAHVPAGAAPERQAELYRLHVLAEPHRTYSRTVELALASDGPVAPLARADLEAIVSRARAERDERWGTWRPWQGIAEATGWTEAELRMAWGDR